MSELSLRVTKRVLEYQRTGSKKERQIAVTEPSADIASELATASRENRRSLEIGGFMTLVLADKGALWRAHNEEQADDFDALFEFLARRPGKRFRVPCSLRRLR